MDEATPRYAATSLVVHQSHGSTARRRARRPDHSVAAYSGRWGPAAFAERGSCGRSCKLTAMAVARRAIAAQSAKGGQIVVRSCQVVARAFAFNWSNSAWVIVPASRSCLADAI